RFERLRRARLLQRLLPDSASSEPSSTAPATGLALNSAVAVARSSSARRRASETVRTACPSLNPSSQSGYQLDSAALVTASASRDPSCTSTTSTSDAGESSRRPYPPTATTQTRSVPRPSTNSAIRVSTSSDLVSQGGRSALTGTG